MMETYIDDNFKVSTYINSIFLNRRITTEVNKTCSVDDIRVTIPINVTGK